MRHVAVCRCRGDRVPVVVGCEPGVPVFHGHTCVCVCGGMGRRQEKGVGTELGRAG